MKKFFALLLVALFGAMPLFADDVDDVKAVIVKNCKLGVKGDFAGVLAMYAPDFRSINSNGLTFNYEQTKWLILTLDGKHPKEFLLVAATLEKKGVMLSADEVQEIHQAASNPEIVKKYKQILPQLVAEMKAGAALELKTLKFDTVKLYGNQAVLIINYDSKEDQSGEIKQKTEIIVLRKIGSEWKIYREVTF